MSARPTLASVSYSTRRQLEVLALPKNLQSVLAEGEIMADRSTA
jgi:hypothetical protein